MINSPYYYQQVFSEINDETITPDISADALGDLRFFINGRETTGSNVEFDIDTKILSFSTSFLRAGDLFEIVRNVPLLQPFNFNQDYESNSIYYLAAALRLLLEDYSEFSRRS